ncbi:MAG: hypothetical protein K8H88_01130, partial [Sandaracinaceae bacterium]|nr:hypothetical protein [Sandaracinaceae bacterium]
GDRILTVAGSAAAAVDFAVHMVQRSRFTPVLATREAALAWMNALRLDGPGYHEWIQTVTGYYNGCLPDVCGVYEARSARYDEAHRVVLDELGEAFFFGGLPPEPIVPAGGCAAIEDLPSCNTAGCVWYSCAEACRDPGTPIEAVCPGVGECGDGRCDSTESCGSCAADCGACAPVCGNGTCESGESCSSCAADCGSCGPVCGNGTCEDGETCSSCADDCGACGGGGCDVPGHLRTGEGYSACSTPEAWRCAFSDRWDTWTSQVCRGGQWLIYTLDPASCASCCGSWSGACE